MAHVIDGVTWFHFTTSLNCFKVSTISDFNDLPEEIYSSFSSKIETSVHSTLETGNNQCITSNIILQNHF